MEKQVYVEFTQSNSNPFRFEHHFQSRNIVGEFLGALASNFVQQTY